jgi:hypothetical protein
MHRCTDERQRRKMRNKSKQKAERRFTAEIEEGTGGKAKAEIVEF